MTAFKIRWKKNSHNNVVMSCRVRKHIQAEEARHNERISGLQTELRILEASAQAASRRVLESQKVSEKVEEFQQPRELGKG